MNVVFILLVGIVCAEMAVLVWVWAGFLSGFYSPLEFADVSRTPITVIFYAGAAAIAAYGYLRRKARKP